MGTAGIFLPHFRQVTIPACLVEWDTVRLHRRERLTGADSPGIGWEMYKKEE